MRNLGPGGDALSILMLEDNPLDVELVEARLRLGGYEYTGWKATCRAEFEEAFASRNYDLILADYSLPDFDGSTALDIVRAKDKFVPFIFVSGALGEDVAVDSLHRGATDYVLKQRLDRLIPAVSRALNEYSERLSRLEAEALLRESELRFQQVTNALPALVWIADASGKLLYSNKSWSDYFGSSNQDSWCDLSLLHIDDVSHVTRQWHDVLQTGSPVELECRFRRTSDSLFRWHLVRIAPLPSSASNAAWVGTCTDLQAQKDREELLRISEKMVVIGRMAGVIAHEINNPLESLTNILFLLRDSDTRVEPGRSLVEEADQQLYRISSITKQTLSFYRDKAALGDIDCERLVQETLLMFRAKLKQQRISVQVQVEGAIQFQARTGEIRQVLVNLLSNAIDAMRKGGQLVIRAHVPDWKRDRRLVLEIEDTGSGIPPELTGRLFEPFVSTKGTLGTGLGLWVSRNIVERHGGTIALGTASGRTTATIILPLEFAGPAEEQSQDDRERISTETVHN